MKKRSARPMTFEYRSSQSYLADLMEWYKKEGISMRSIAIKLEVSPSLLCLIVKGKRPLIQENIERWASYFNWSDQEISWLKQLITFEYAAMEDKEKALTGMTRFNEFKNQKDNVIMFRYLKKWWNVAIREMSALPDFVEEPEWISERLVFKVPLNDIRKSLLFLNKHKLLAKYGSLRTINCDGDIYKLSLSGFHDQILSKAVESIYKLPSEERYILGHTMAIPDGKFEEAKVILEDALRKISALHSDKKAQSVYHFSFLGFPLSSKESV